MDKDKDGLLSQDEWSAAELWFQYRAARPETLSSAAVPAPGETVSESLREHSELIEAQPHVSSSGSGGGASGRQTSVDGERWPDPATSLLPRTPPVDDGQYDR